MKTLIMAFLLMALPAHASRITTYSKQCSAQALTGELRAAGFLVESVVGSGHQCVISLDDAEKKNPSAVLKAHVYVSPRKLADGEQQAVAVELNELEAKLNDGTISPAETRQLLKLILKMLHDVKR